MNFEAGNVVASAQAGWAALSALAVTYAFSVVGALVLLVVGFIVAGYAERWSGPRRVQTPWHGHEAARSVAPTTR